MKERKQRPTEAELEILNVLWDKGPASVRQVHTAIETHRGEPVLYTTVLKLLQIMATKGLVRRQQSGRAHVYEASVPKEQTQRSLLADLRDRAFAGSAAQLVMQALSGKPATPEEIREIRDLLDRFERGEQ